MLEALGEHLVRLEQAFLDVVRVCARRDAVERRADGAPLPFQRMAQHARDRGMLEEDLLAALRVARERRELRRRVRLLPNDAVDPARE